MASVQQPIYPKVEAAEPSAPPPYSTQYKAYPAQSQPFPTQPQPWNYPPETYGKPADPAVGYWHPQQPGYTGLPQSEAGFAGHPPGQPGVVIVPQKGQQVVVVRERESFVKQIVLSCVVTWCCCWPLGLVAFILAMVANSNANATDENSVKKAHNLGVHSCRTSIAGIIIGVILIIIYICLQVFVKSKYADGEP